MKLELDDDEISLLIVLMRSRLDDLRVLNIQVSQITEERNIMRAIIGKISVEKKEVFQ